jgi:hypothetical protein
LATCTSPKACASDAVLLDWADQEDPNDPIAGLVVVKAFKLNTGQKAAW